MLIISFMLTMESCLVHVTLGSLSVHSLWLRMSFLLLCLLGHFLVRCHILVLRGFSKLAVEVEFHCLVLLINQVFQALDAVFSALSVMHNRMFVAFVGALKEDSVLCLL